jgi:hypothetical protein
MSSDARVKALEDAVLYLWNAWSEAEGDGQPKAWVFGPDEKMRAWYVEMEESFQEAPPEVQAVIRELLSTPHPS